MKFNWNNNVYIFKYDIEKIAGDGTEFEKALKLMDAFSPRLTHNSYFE